MEEIKSSVPEGRSESQELALARWRIESLCSAQKELEAEAGMWKQRAQAAENRCRVLQKTLDGIRFFLYRQNELTARQLMEGARLKRELAVLKAACRKAGTL